MTMHKEFKAELMKDWGFRWRWYLSSPKYWVISVLIRLLGKLSGEEKLYSPH